MSNRPAAVHRHRELSNGALVLHRASRKILKGASPEVLRAAFHGKNRWVAAAILELVFSEEGESLVADRLEATP